MSCETPQRLQRSRVSAPQSSRQRTFPRVSRLSLSSGGAEQGELPLMPSPRGLRARSTAGESNVSAGQPAMSHDSILTIIERLKRRLTESTSGWSGSGRGATILFFTQELMRQSEGEHDKRLLLTAAEALSVKESSAIFEAEGRAVSALIMLEATTENDGVRRLTGAMLDAIDPNVSLTACP